MDGWIDESMNDLVNILPLLSPTKVTGCFLFFVFL